MHTSAPTDYAAEALAARKRGPRPSKGNPRPRSHAGEVHEPASKDITLEHVLVAARNRAAPVSVETAGYIALAVADALAMAPAVLRAINVRLTAGGIVAVVGAAGHGTDADAEQCVRTLLGRLLAVAVGSSPALTTCAKRPGGRGVTVLVRELEAALIPTNRAAARRSIARLARETERAAPDITGDAKDPLSAAPATAERPRKARTDPPPAKVLTPTPIEPIFQQAVREARCTARGQAVDTTDVDDAIVAPVEPTPAPFVRAMDSSTSTSSSTTWEPPGVLQAATQETPRLATYDPHTCTGAPADVVEDHDPQATPFDEVDDAELLTYEPPDVADEDGVLDFGTASPPAVCETPGQQEAWDPDAAAAPHSDPRPEAEVTRPTPAAPAKVVPKDSHRLDELLASFGAASHRSTREVAGDLKALVGLPPTPPPPSVETDEPEADEPDEVATSEPSVLPAAKDPIAFVRARNPKLTLALSVVLLVLAILGMGAVYLAFPQLLLGH
jgi:hypothetical protein